MAAEPTAFQERVYEAVRAIPLGSVRPVLALYRRLAQVTSYGAVARAVGGSARAVGGAMRGNLFVPGEVSVDLAVN